MSAPSQPPTGKPARSGGDPAATGQSEAVRVVRAFLDAANRHDVEAAMNHLAPDYVFREESAESGWDRTSMRAVFEWDAVIDAQAIGDQLTPIEGGAEGEFLERNKLYEVLGIPETRCHLRFHVAGGRIVAQIITHQPSDGPTFDEAVTPFLEWLGEEDPDAFEELLPNGEVTFQPDLAHRWLELIAKWKGSPDS